MTTQIIKSSYQAPTWLKGGHSQTIWPVIAMRDRSLAFRTEFWTAPDGASLKIDCIDGASDAPCVVLFHGLEGSSRSHYAQSIMRVVQSAGWNGKVVHFRGCGGQVNVSRRAYFAGDSAEIAWLLQKASQMHQLCFAVGVSLGGNMLLRFLGEYPKQDFVKKAAAVSVPLDLKIAGVCLDQGFSKHVYTRHFLHTLKPKTRLQHAHHPDLFNLTAIEKATTFIEFDDLVTSRLHGYDGVEDYYARASAKPILIKIQQDTLVLNAQNDPFFPAWALPTLEEVSPYVYLEQPLEGGHVGFTLGGIQPKFDWLGRRLLQFFSS